MENNSNSTHLNRLAKEKSPYLLQHQHNPVDWYPWGEEAFEKARKEDKLIFLSVGYSTCHWCHVMAHESFESESIAKIMNENFVNIKVDREERPDVDKIYMTYVQASTGHGGWPMSAWLTPSLKPVVAGTYFPPADSYGRPGFPTILQRISTLWKTKKDDLIEQGNRTIDALQESSLAGLTEKGEKSELDTIITKETINKCYNQIAKSYDSELGGFGEAPKFPRPVIFNLLMRIANREGSSATGKKALEMCRHTLKKMGEGGIFDFLGGGYHRYSTTSDWHVPHFEKMLYDQAQLVNSYLDVYLATKDQFFENRARDVMDYVIDKLQSREGGIFSAEDADSAETENSSEKSAHQKKTEGAFYVWTKKEIETVVGKEPSEIFAYHYGVLTNGNVSSEVDHQGELKGKNVLIQRHSIEETTSHFKLKSVEECGSMLADMRKKLFDVREKRPRPHLDDKIITSWNGLMISAFARGYQVLRDEKYLTAATRAAKFIKDQLYDSKSNSLIRNYREGPSKVNGFGDDYAFLTAGLIDLYEASFDLEWLKWSIALQEKQNEVFWDKIIGGYFGVAEGDKNLVLRLKEEYDGAEPSNNSVAACNLARLSYMIGNSNYKKMSEDTINAFKQILSKAPIVMPQICVAMDILLSQTPSTSASSNNTMKSILIVGEKNSKLSEEFIKEINSHYLPNKVVLLIDQESKEYLSKSLEYVQGFKIGDQAKVVICENFTCNLPITSVEELSSKLKNNE